MKGSDVKKPSTKDKKHHDHHIPSYMKNDVTFDDSKKK